MVASAPHVVVRRQLRLDAGNRDKAPDAQVHALRDVGKVDVEIFERGIEAVLVVVDRKLAEAVALVDGVTVVRAVEGRQVEADVDVVALDRVGQALDINHGLP
jgi:hypothetical protein